MRYFALNFHDRPFSICSPNTIEKHFQNSLDFIYGRPKVRNLNPSHLNEWFLNMQNSIHIPLKYFI